jgi:hypothetical protein
MFKICAQRSPDSLLIILRDYTYKIEQTNAAGEIFPFVIVLPASLGVKAMSRLPYYKLMAGTKRSFVGRKISRKVVVL